MRELTVERNRVDAVLARLARHAELTQAVEVDGLVSVRSWLIGHLRLSGAEASRIVRVGRAVEHFPVLGAAFADGGVSAAQVDVVASAVGDRSAQREQQGIDLGVFDRAWTQVATTSSHRALVVAVQAFVEALDPDGTEPDPVEQRALSISTHADGSVTGRFDLDAVRGEKVKTALESIVQADRPEGDARTRVQRQADALVSLADRQLAAGGLPVLRSVKPHVVVTIGIEDLVADAPARPPRRWGSGPPSLRRPRPLVGLRRGGVADRDGSPTACRWTWAAPHRVVTPGLRRAVVARTRPACSPAAAPRTTGRRTRLPPTTRKLAAAPAAGPEPHHTKVHHGFRVERDPGGAMAHPPPDGTEILLGPSHHLMVAGPPARPPGCGLLLVGHARRPMPAGPCPQGSVRPGSGTRAPVVHRSPALLPGGTVRSSSQGPGGSAGWPIRRSASVSARSTTASTSRPTPTTSDTGTTSGTASTEMASTPGRSRANPGRRTGFASAPHRTPPT